MLAGVALTIAAAVPFSAGPTAPVPVDSYRVVVRQSGERPEIRTVAAPDRYRIRSTSPGIPVLVGRGGNEYSARSAGSDGSVLRNLFAAAPDGFSGGDDRYSGLRDFVLAGARSGTLALTATSLAGRPAWRADVPLAANDCAGLPRRTARIWIARRTHLVLRVVERARSNGRVLHVTSYAYSPLNGRFPPAAFVPPRVGPRPFTLNNRFSRTSPAAAAGPLPYVPRVPTVLPSGFELAVAGWAPRSGITGPEGSIPPLPWLFGAVYRRGSERIDVTQRVAKGGWPVSPFGVECQPLPTEDVTVGGVPATYGTGEGIGPHLFWRDGPLLYTVRGPFSRDDLIAIAASLRKLGS